MVVRLTTHPMEGGFHCLWKYLAPEKLQYAVKNIEDKRDIDAKEKRKMSSFSRVEENVIKGKSDFLLFTHYSTINYAV